MLESSWNDAFAKKESQLTFGGGRDEWAFSRNPTSGKWGKCHSVDGAGSVPSLVTLAEISRSDFLRITQLDFRNVVSEMSVFGSDK